MNSKSSIKFRFEVNLINNDILNNIFSKLDSLLNIRFDENSNPYVFANNEI
ncbi:hypothetical protein [Methanobrevibacter sp.]|uniref:hypothetical protein n=1 Tax=Methanobrevibacter sp. TaxID=66852 RepID=UPI0025E4329C|nr:hypothetical protein [Methanobrevibacter sp.]MBQ2666627.1 hypothetical protein [Methanobrevibacter sp.]